MRVNDLLLQKRASTFTFPHFEQFTKMVVGLWSSKKCRRGLVFERYKASVVHGVQLADRNVDTGVLSSDPASSKRRSEQTKKLPLTNISYNEPCSIPRQCKEMELVYFTMEQKSLFQHHKHALVRGAAGSGKSLLLLMKIIELAKSGTSKTLLIADDPFNIKCCNILTANGVSCDIITTFPRKPVTTASTSASPTSQPTLSP